MDVNVDVVVVGAGQAGLVAAVLAASRGMTTTLIEARDVLGGTAAKSSGVMWIPNNRFMRQDGVSDPRDDALRYMARLATPRHYSSTHPTLGLADWELDSAGVFYDHASRALDSLIDIGALDVVYDPTFVDYYAHLPENVAPYGRTVFPRPGHGKATGGKAATDILADRAAALGVSILTKSHVVDVLVDDGAVVSVVSEDNGGRRTKFNVGGGVIFTTGGFSRNPTMMRQNVALPYGPGCAVATNTGGFVPIAQRLGAQFDGMDKVWAAPIVFERTLREPEAVCASFYLPGDGFLITDLRGRRVVDEKAPYNEFTKAFFDFDWQGARYPAIPMIMIWDADHAQIHAGSRLGNPVPPADVDGYWVVEGADLNELAQRVEERLASLAAELPQATLDPNFATTLASTIGRFNHQAADGVDEDFGRGATTYEQQMALRMGPGKGTNPTLRPLAENGPYYATLLTPAAFDTKGGPRIDEHARVVDVAGQPIEGLYAAGNCAASPTGESYWSGGASLALAMCFGYLAAEHSTQRAAERAAQQNHEEARIAN